MANYSDIRGYRVKYLVSDPTLSTANEGQVWYNSTEGVLKSLVQIKAWSAGGNMNSARSQLYGAGTQTATVGFGPSATEEYNGYSWATSGTLNTTRSSITGAGTQTAALGFGGYIPPNSNATEEYDGATWTTVNNTPFNLNSAGGVGTQTAALGFGGSQDGFPNQNKTISYDGTNWTTLPANMNSGRRLLGGNGTQTAALAVGGVSPNTSPSVNGTTESWDGSAWTSVAFLGTARYRVRSVGTYDNAIAFAGAVYLANAEEWDGTSWSNTTSLSTGRKDTAGSGLRSNALCFGGQDSGGATAATEEYNSNIQAISKDVWASGGTVSNTSRNRASFGTQTAGTLAGGYIGANSQTRDTEEYNGTSWSAGGALLPQGNPDGGTYGGMSTGTQTAGLFGGGSSQGAVDYYFNTTQEYNGSTWSSPTTFPSTGRLLGGMFGTQTAAVTFGGYRTGTYYTNVDKYNGTTWTAGTAIPTGTAGATTSGTETAGLGYGGYTATPARVGTTYTYDGSTWTTVSPMAEGRSGLGGSNAGTQTASIAFAGYNGTATVTSTESYNGSVWSSSANMATANSSFKQGSGTAAAALAGGGTPSAVEEFTGGSSVITASTLTTS